MERDESCKRQTESRAEPAPGARLGGAESTRGVPKKVAAGSSDLLEEKSPTSEHLEKLLVKSLERCNTSSSIESADLPKEAMDLLEERNHPFERFYYIRVRDRVCETTHRKYVAIRKSYWLYPSLAAETPDFCKEDVEKVTSFAVNRKHKSKTLRDEADISEFLLQFFAGFHVKSGEFVNYLVQEAKPLSSFVSEYNSMGWRHVYCLRFPDFDLNLSDKEQLSLEVNQSVFAFESKYPFKQFFEKFLTSIFNQIRLDRLGLFGQGFCPNDLKSALKFDAKVVKQVRCSHQLLGGQACNLLQKVFAGTFEAPIRLPESLCGSKFVYRPTLQNACISDSLESSAC